MLRIKGVSKDEASEEVRKIFEQQEKQYGSILNTAPVYGLRPTIQQGVQALQQVIFLAHGRDRGFDFTAAVPAILSIYENETDEAFRIMALSALNEIGDAHAMQRLDARVRAEPSKRVRLLTEVVLKGYYEARGQHYQAYNR